MGAVQLSGYLWLFFFLVHASIVTDAMACLDALRPACARNEHEPSHIGWKGKIVRFSHGRVRWGHGGKAGGVWCTSVSFGRLRSGRIAWPHKPYMGRVHAYTAPHYL